MIYHIFLAVVTTLHVITQIQSTKRAASSMTAKRFVPQSGTNLAADYAASPARSAL